MATEKNAVVGGTLYLVATPIGNMADISERAVKTLSEVDFIAAEDTRNTGKLLSLLGISKPMVSYFEHNKRERGLVITARIESGESCALVTDAGMPAISDPGEDIVQLCAQIGIPVSIIPGPCAAVSALALSGLPTGRFAFEGFLSTATSERKKRLTECAKEPRTLIFYEAPHKLRSTLNDMYDVFGDRRIALCRELTKINEEIIRTTLSGAIDMYSDNLSPRGEYVIIIAGADIKKDVFWNNMSVADHVAFYLKQGLKKMDAIKAAAHDRGVAKSEIYSAVVNIEL